MPTKLFTKTNIYKAKYHNAKQDFKKLTNHDKVVVSAAKRAVGRRMETKYQDTPTTGTNNWSTTALQSDVTGILQGITQLTRLGANITPKKMEVMFNAAAGSADSDNRLIIFVWKPDNAVAPVIGNILSNGPSGIPDNNSLYNYNNRLQYRILYDQHFVLVAGTSSPNHSIAKKIVLYKNLPAETSYSLTLNTGENHIYLLLLGSNAGVNAPSINLIERIYYKDS